MIPVITMETIAANLGSMATPVGNPQNLYLYSVSGMSALSFCKGHGTFVAGTFASSDRGLSVT